MSHSKKKNKENSKPIADGILFSPRDIEFRKAENEREEALIKAERKIQIILLIIGYVFFGGVFALLLWGLASADGFVVIVDVAIIWWLVFRTYMICVEPGAIAYGYVTGHDIKICGETYHRSVFSKPHYIYGYYISAIVVGEKNYEVGRIETGPKNFGRIDNNGPVYIIKVGRRIRAVPYEE